MTRTPVSSSNIKSVGYDPQKQILEVEFHTGAVHQYDAVPPAKHAAMMRAESPGGYFGINIRNFHKSRKL
jgi:hypothetical protein